MTSSASIYVAVRARCRAVGLSMQSADFVISAFHALGLYSMEDVQTALAKAAPMDAKPAKKGDAKETKGDAKSDSKSSSGKDPSPAAQKLTDDVTKALPKGAKSIPADAEDAADAVPLSVIIVRIIGQAASRTATATAASAGNASSSGGEVKGGASLSLTRSATAEAAGGGPNTDMLPLPTFLRRVVHNGASCSGSGGGLGAGAGAGDQWTDVTLVVQGEKFRAHKILLSRSPFFAAMFSRFQESKSNEVELKDVDAKDFRNLLEFIYTDVVPFAVVSPQHSMRLFQLADRFNLTQLAEACARLFAETLDVDNVEECYLLSLSPGHELLKERCLAFITAQFASVMTATDGFARTAASGDAEALRQLLLAKHPVARRSRGKRFDYTDALDASLCSPLATLSQEGRRVERTTNNGEWATVLGKDVFETGVHVMTIRVVRSANSCLFGAQQEAKLPPSYLGDSTYSTAACMSGWQRTVYFAGVAEETYTRAENGGWARVVGTEVSCELDLESRRIRWAVNGHWHPYRDLRGKTGGYRFGVGLDAGQSGQTLEIVEDKCSHTA